MNLATLRLQVTEIEDEDLKNIDTYSPPAPWRCDVNPPETRVCPPEITTCHEWHCDPHNPKKYYTDFGGSSVGVDPVTKVRVKNVVSSCVGNPGAADTWNFAGLNCQPSLKSTLDSFVDNTAYFARLFGHYGVMDWIGSLGAYVSNRTTGTSYHNTGEAVDIAYIRWRPRAGSTIPVDCRPCDADSDADQSTSYRRLVAVEAGLRKQFGYVLNRGTKNSDGVPDHKDHFHVDNGFSMGLAGVALNENNARRPFSSGAFFLQDCVRAFTNEQPEYDGLWGQELRYGLQTLLTAMGMDCLDIGSSLTSYWLFLDYIMMHGFADAPAGAYSWGGVIPTL